MGRARYRARDESLQLIVGTHTSLVFGVLFFALSMLIACAPPPASTPSFTSVNIPEAPESNWLNLVARYLGKSPEPLSNDILYPNDAIGTTASFWVLDLDGPKMRQVRATLQHVSQTALWYVSDALEVDAVGLRSAANTFDNRLLPEVQRLFSPGFEMPGKVTILNARTPGLGGYFASDNAQPSSAQRFSNERMMMVMNGSRVGTERYNGTLAHELAHLISWHIDSTEESWVAEGLAEFAADSLKLPSIPYDAYFNNPNVSLSNWPEIPDLAISAYAAASLFFSYLHTRLGIKGIQQIVSQPLNGVDGMNAFFESQTTDFSSFFGDWLAANVARANDGPYAYEPPLSSAVVGDFLSAPGTVSDAAPQLGGRYLRIDPGGTPLQVRFDGASSTPVLPVAPHSGDHCWWGNRGDSISSTLTREFNIQGIANPTLHFWTWYAIEDVFDRAYVAASIDNGTSWQLLEGEHTTNIDPIGTTLGPSYTGASGRWFREQIDLTPYAGGNLLLSFNYVTDQAVSSVGWCIDDIRIPELGFNDDAEVDSGWQAEGFVLIHREGIAQDFVLRIISGSGDNSTVTTIALDNNNDATFRILL